MESLDPLDPVHLNPITLKTPFTLSLPLLSSSPLLHTFRSISFVSHRTPHYSPLFKTSGVAWYNRILFLTEEKKQIHLVSLRTDTEFIRIIFSLLTKILRLQFLSLFLSLQLLFPLLFIRHTLLTSRPLFLLSLQT